ncbi:MAG: hypothetical protein ABSH24_01255, partial [Bryobacteraceae bacterium]
RYTIDNDGSGDPSLFFRITLSDEAAKPQNLLKITKYINGIVEQRINPRGQWGSACGISPRHQIRRVRPTCGERFPPRVTLSSIC